MFDIRVDTHFHCQYELCTIISGRLVTSIAFGNSLLELFFLNPLTLFTNNFSRLGAAQRPFNY